VRERLDDFLKDGDKSDDELVDFLKALKTSPCWTSPHLAQIALPHGAIVCMSGGQFQDEIEHAVTIAEKGKFWLQINIMVRALTQVVLLSQFEHAGLHHDSEFSVLFGRSLLCSLPIDFPFPTRA
jgi:hypothetical protein